MKLKKILVLFSLAVIATLSSFIEVKDVPKPQETLRTIIVDAGHGLPDPGAKGKYSHESAVALAVALKLGKQLEENLPGCKILYTRTDENLPNGLTNKNEANRWRAKFSNDNRGDLFIAIHCNSTRANYHREKIGTRKETYYKGKGKKRKKYTRRVPIYRSWTTPSEVQGTETYIWAVNKNDQKKEYVGSMAEDTEGMSEEDSLAIANFFDSPEAKILASLRTKKYFDKSKMLAELVEDEFVKGGRSSRGAKQRNEEGILVLAATAMPSVLVEIGFISNPEEEDYINSDKGQNEIVYAIMRAVLRYKENLGGGAAATTASQP
ncbi:N-acetylmuramoyl-L-alanine amidase family protein [Foetidibacter luteolus]|uniref:N-acetylmuramoyl-L-alanine amidase family protein n=1 Tax=Foetidibacter luteolus TaxID=2608880 RepID=UPI00129AEFF9|nr:N-acetylmuramoyl-L-alanine amidase [Foetidibacter luteolus]